ncbi:hypothetical protein OQA88_11677 [Cercophora sp. LCS_1]
MPKFALLVRATLQTESRTPTSATPALLEAMLAYNTSLVDAGVLLSGDGFLPSSKGARVHFSSNETPRVEHGPFDVSSLVSGYWVLKVKDLEEALEWAKKVPFGEGDVVEVRQIAGEDDFEMTDGMKEKEEELRKRIEEGQ